MLPNMEEGGRVWYMDQVLDMPPNTIFVFGSNLAGRHGAGAAHTAMMRFGANYGQGVGLQGNSYGIPTKDERIVTMPLVAIEPYVREFVELTRRMPNVRWYVTPIGTGLAGYNHAEIAPMFRGVINAYLPVAWRDYMGNQ